MNLKYILAGAALALTAASGSLADTTKVGFVYVGPVGDGGWTYEHDQGRMAVESGIWRRSRTLYSLKTFPKAQTLSG